MTTGVRSFRRKTALFLATVALPLPAFSQQIVPTGGTFVAGAGDIQSGANGLAINQTSGTAIVEWQDFSISPGASVHFDNGTGATLNRVTGNLGSEINGSLTATGSVYLVNPPVSSWVRAVSSRPAVISSPPRMMSRIRTSSPTAP